MNRILVLLMLCTNISFSAILAGDIIKLPKHYKTESTFSGDMEGSNSFHLIFTKNKKTKTYEVFVYLFDGSLATQLGVLKSNQSYNVISFHVNENDLTLLVSYSIKGKKYAKHVRINSQLKTIDESEAFDHSGHLSTIRKKNRSILLYKKDESLIIKEFEHHPRAKEHKIEMNGDNENVAAFLNDFNLSPVNTDEFVENGSTADKKVYLFNNELIFTKDNEKQNTTQAFKIPLDAVNSMSKITTISNQSGHKFRRMASYVFKNRLFRLFVDKTLGYIRIDNLEKAASGQAIAMNDELKENISADDGFKGIADFLKRASKKKHIPTITVNETKSGRLRLRIDYVDQFYGYNYDWWFHHQFMWQMQQMQFHNNAINSVPSFGPNEVDDEVSVASNASRAERFFELMLTENLELVTDDGEMPVHKEVKKKDYIDKLEENRNYSNSSSCFLKDSFRFIAYSKSSKGYVIQTNLLR